MKLPKWGIVGAFSGLILLLSAVILLTSALTTRHALLRHAHDIMANIASYTIDKSESHLIPARDAARLTRGLADSNIVDSEDAAGLEKYFYEQMAVYPQFSAIYYGTEDGAFVMASRYNKRDPAGFFTKIISTAGGDRTVSLIWKDSTGRSAERALDPLDTYDPRQRPWYRKAVQERRLIWTDPYVFFTSQKPGITTATPVYTPEGRLRGVIGVDIEIAELSDFIARLKISRHGLAFIVNRNGDVIAYPNLDKIRRPSQETGKLRLARISELEDPICRKAYESLGPGGGGLLSGPVFTTFDLDGEAYHAMFAPFKNPQWPWAIGIYLPEDDYLGGVKRIQNVNISIALAATILAGLIGMSVTRKLARARDAARAADVTKSQFLTKMSHEIRTPMNAVLGMADMLWETPLSREQRNYTRILRSSGELLLDLINDVLDISKIESGRLELEDIEYDPRVVLHGVARVLAVPAHRKGLELVCRVSPAVPALVSGDPTRLRQVLVNLVGNAVKFTNVGEVVVGMERVVDAPDNAGFLMFWVSDTGIGIPREKADAIYEPFSQADASTTRAHGGTGLGLAISRRLVEMMGGRIWVESGAVRGTTFRFTVRAGQASSPARPQPAPERFKGLRVLVVDDNATAREATAAMLMDWAVRTEAAGDASTALTLLAEAQAADRPFDLVVLDHPLPPPDGGSLPREIRRLHPDARTVLLVSTYAHAMESEPHDPLADAVLTKPPTPQEFSRSLQEALDHAPHDAEPAPPPPPGASGRPLRILLAEDSRSNAELMRLYLKETGHDLDVAANGEQAVRMAESQAYDLVFMDMQMPVMDGYEATRRIRRMEAADPSRHRTTIVAATAMAMADEQRRCLEAGCDAYLAKPFKKREVLETVARLAFARGGGEA
ncbi:MAG: response regulator [Desulfovibrionaceae bacterium]|jgi:signal transduction histidine kinase/CheY-like chemotaxis protein|nr:response regulator [Desulfovibrionaceae bacterium]